MNSPCANHDDLGGQADISVEALDLLIDDVNFFKAKSEHLQKECTRMAIESTNTFLAMLAYFQAATGWSGVYAGIEALEANQNRAYPLKDRRKEKTE